MTQVGFKTDKGRKRDRNEDAFFVMPRKTSISSRTALVARTQVSWQAPWR
jgi:hypothetical protein